MRRLLLAALLCTATPALAQVRSVPIQPPSEAEALRGVEVYLMNEGVAPIAAEGPRQLEVTALDGTRLVLERVPGPHPVIAPGSFAKVRYVPVSVAARPPAPAPAPPIALAGTGETILPSSTGTSSGFLDRFRPHEPIYGAFGLDDAGGKLQVSFALQPFAGDGPPSHLRFGYTQTMFWALAEPSAPFRSTTYSPEVFVTAPVGDSATVDLGFRHDSNGRGELDSIDANRIYLRVAKRFDLGNGWQASITPQAWLYVGEKGVATDIDRYWGYSSVTAAIQQENGLKLALTGRGSFETGRASAEAFLSYPLEWIGGMGIYLFGQAYTGYGETLDEYRVRDSHARLGIAFTR